jgi:hypothetical protein
MPNESRLYAKLTLDFADSHKIAPLSDAAFRAYIRMLLWSRRMLTDGRVPVPMAKVFAKPSVLSELTGNDPVAPSLTLDGTDYIIHDFAEHQSTRAEIEAQQERNRENGRRGGQAKAKQLASNSLTDSPSDFVAKTYTESESQSETETTNQDSSRSSYETRPPADVDLTKVKAAVMANCGRECSTTDAFRIIGTVMERSKVAPKNPTAYIVKAIATDPYVFQQMLDEGHAA